MSEPYTPQSRLLAQLMAQRHAPVQSVGQGVADVFGDIGGAYFDKKQLDKDEEKSKKSASVIADLIAKASNPNYTGEPMDIAQNAAPGFDQMGQAPQGQSAPPPPAQGSLGPAERLMQAFQGAAAQDPKAALQGLPQAAQLATMFQKEAPTALPPVKPGESIPMRNPRTGEITYSTVPGKPKVSGTIGEAKDALDGGLINQAQYDRIVASVGREPGEGKITYRPMTAAEKTQWGIPAESAASMGSNGKPDIINKGAPGSFLSEQGISPDATPDEIKAKLGTTEAGSNLLRQAQAIVDGREELQKISARSGETQGNQIRSVVYAIDPGFNPMVGKQRVQINTELNNLSDRAMGGKIASANKIVNHATNLLDQAIDLKNDSWAGNLGNRVENALVSAGTGGAMKTNLRSFTNTKDLLGTEAAKFMGGGVASDSARAEVDKNYNPNDDLSGTIGAVGSTVDMMKGQLQPMVDRYNQAFGTNLPVTDPKFMSPETAAKFQTLEGILATAKSGKPIDPASLKSALAAVNGGGKTADTAAPKGWSAKQISP